jgi:hypothetical protein
LILALPVASSLDDAEDLLWESRPELFLEFDRVSERCTEILWIMTISRVRLILAVQVVLLIGSVLNRKLERRYRWYRRLVRIDPPNATSSARGGRNSLLEEAPTLSTAATASNPPHSSPPFHSPNSSRFES